MNQAICTVPSNFDPVAILGPELEEFADGARLILDFLIQEEADHREYGGRFPIKAAYMRNLFPGRRGRAAYPLIWRRLEEAGWIVCDRIKLWGDVGQKCFHFGLGPIASRQVDLVPLQDDISARVLKARSKAWDEITDPNHIHLRDWLPRIDLDLEGATRHLRQLELEPWRESRHLVALQKIHSGQLRMSADPYGRIHTNFSNLKKNFRDYLSCHGERLVTRDIANCQPLLSAWMACQWHKNENNENKDSQEEKKKRRTSVGILLCHRALPNDLKQCLRDCEEGRFWDVLLEAQGYTSKKSVLKVRYMEAAYGPPGKNTIVAKALQRHYPTLWEFMEKEKAGDYRRFAHHLQRAESGIVIGAVVGRLRMECPQAPLVTIHDAIMTTPHYVPVIERIMAEEFTKIGLRVTIRG